MGGMFDPVHNGHLNIALGTQQRLQLDRLALLPCGIPVHRANDLTPAMHRLAMLHLALQDHAGLVVDDRECLEPAPSYAFNSLQAIRRENPEAALYYLVGQDAFNKFHTWYHWREIFGLTHIVVAARPGATAETGGELSGEVRVRKVESVDELKQSTCGKIFTLEMPMLDISSTMVRERVSRHEPIDDLVPTSVADYIETNGLYTAENNA